MTKKNFCGMGEWVKTFWDEAIQAPINPERSNINISDIHKHHQMLTKYLRKHKYLPFSHLMVKDDFFYISKLLIVVA